LAEINVMLEHERMWKRVLVFDEHYPWLFSNIKSLPTVCSCFTKVI